MQTEVVTPERADTPVTTPTAATTTANTPSLKPSKAAKKKSTIEKRRTSTTNSTGGKTSRRRRRRRRPRIPNDFEQWKEPDKATFLEVNRIMKNWKATQKQCEPIISQLDRFKALKHKVRHNNPVYNREVAEYEKAKKAFPTIGKEETFDFERA
uniref:HMG box domain-containing protein n=1 Tax=Panagrellus redivivus TaxID=6233 RepID=A0A7E4VVJ7_PANRE